MLKIASSVVLVFLCVIASILFYSTHVFAETLLGCPSDLNSKVIYAPINSKSNPPTYSVSEELKFDEAVLVKAAVVTLSRGGTSSSDGSFKQTITDVSRKISLVIPPTPLKTNFIVGGEGFPPGTTKISIKGEILSSDAYFEAVLNHFCWEPRS